MKNSLNNGQSASKPLSSLEYEEGSTTIETTLARDKGVEYTRSSGKGRNLQKVYIYALIDPRNNHIKYVGQTMYIKRRFWTHKNDKNNTIKSHRINWIKSLKDLEPELLILDQCLETDWEFWEKYWISQCKTWGFKLTNLTEGGQGTIRKQSKEEKIKRGLVAKGKKRSEKTRKLMSESRMGMKFTEQHKLNLSLSHKGKAPKTKKRYCRKIKQMKDGEIIKIWDSIKEAAIFYKVNNSSIGHCCAGRKKSVKGYNWEYL